MKILTEILTNWKMWTIIIAGLSLLYSIFNHVIQSRVHSKLNNNDLKHLTDDMIEMKSEHKELKVDLKKDLEKIFRRLGKIDKGQGIRKAICDERHKIDK